MIRRTAALIGSLAVAAASACSPSAILNATLPGEGYSMTGSGIAYGPEERQELDVYSPANRPDRPAPVIVYLYGGSWKSGNRAMYRFIGQAYASRGYVVVVPDYRLYPDVTFPTFMYDAARAIDWVAENIGRYGGDPDRVFLYGHSAGAHMAALMAVDDRYLAEFGRGRSAFRGVIGVSGPYWFNPLEYRSTRPVFVGTQPIDRARPIAQVERPVQPMLLLHGAMDGTVYPLNTERFAERLREVGSSVEAKFYPDTGHIGIILAATPLFRGNAPLLQDTLDFLARQSGN